MLKFVLGIYLVFGYVSVVRADAHPFQQAEQAYKYGDYDTSIELTEEHSAFFALLLNAEARLARLSLTMSPDPQTDLKRARQAAHQALVLQKKAVRPRFVLIAVIGYQARQKSLFTGLRKGWAKKGRNLIDESLSLEPDNPWGHALSGSWHLEILRRTSKRRATLVGASIKGAARSCEQAIFLAPDDARISAQCGLALLAANQNELDEAAWQTLELAATTTHITDAFSCIRRYQAARVLEVKSSAGLATARKLATHYLLAKTSIDWPTQCGRSSLFQSGTVSGLHSRN